MKLSEFKYQKSLLLLASVLLAVYLFTKPSVVSVVSNFGDVAYLFALTAGLFFSYGFTFPLAAGLFISLNPGNLLLALLLGSLGSLITNLFILYYFKHSFMGEFDSLKRPLILRTYYSYMKKSLFNRIEAYALCSLASLLIAIPMTEKLETIFITAMREIKFSTLVILSFIFHTILILIMLSI